MRLVSVMTLRPSAGPLIRLAFGLLVVSSTCLSGLAQTPPVNSTIRVCVTDEADPSTKLKDKVFITLFNTASKIGKAGDDGCFTSVPARYDPNRTYFAVAVKDDKLGFSGFTFKNEDNNQVRTVDLKLAKSIKNSDLNAVITICVEDEDKNRITVKDIVLSGGNERPKVLDTNSGCVRVQPTLVSDYQLNLVAASSVTTPLPKGILGIPWLQLVLMIAILLSMFGVVAMLNHTIKREVIDLVVIRSNSIQGAVELIATNVNHIRDKVDQEKDGSSLPAVIAPVTAPADSIGSEGAIDKKDDDASQLSGDDHQTAQTEATRTPFTEEGLRDPHIAQARQKYSDVLAKKEVNFFFLMPVGESDASNLVGEARVKLRQQSSGKYIAFCSDDSESEAWLFPKPNLHFTPETFSAVFPDLEEQDYQSGNIDPKKAVSTEPKLWKIE